MYFHYVSYFKDGKASVEWQIEPTVDKKPSVVKDI